MRVFTGAAQVPRDFGPSAVAVGKFDGVHLGHLAIIERLVKHARDKGLESVVVTFDRNPLEVLAPEKCPIELMPLDRRFELFELAGVAAVLVLPFTREFANESPETFIDEVLVGALNARIVLAGQDFRFGHRGAGNVDLLRVRGEARGFSVEPVAPVLVNAQPVSSTRIRLALAEGRVAEAGGLLGRPPEVTGLVVPGARRGRLLGFPTANLGAGISEGHQIPVGGYIPADGVYAGWVVPHASGDGVQAGVPLPAAISVGTNPTFEGVPRTVEAHILDRTLDLYGMVLTVEFVSFVRPMLAFSGIDELIQSIQGDVDIVRIVLGQVGVAGGQVG